MRIQFWFEFASTYSYPAAMRIEAAAAARGVAVEWKRVPAGTDLPEPGLERFAVQSVSVKGRYMWRDLSRLCEELHCRSVRPSQFPRNGLLAARVACAYASEPWLPAFVRAVYDANFARDEDIASTAVIARCLESVGERPEALLAAAGSRSEQGEAARAGRGSRAPGLFGAPSFVAGQELFWGNDRLETALDWVERHAA